MLLKLVESPAPKGNLQQYIHMTRCISRFLSVIRYRLGTDFASVNTINTTLRVLY